MGAGAVPEELWERIESAMSWTINCVMPSACGDMTLTQDCSLLGLVRAADKEEVEAKLTEIKGILDQQRALIEAMKPAQE